jgi:hypothetical protein
LSSDGDADDERDRERRRRDRRPRGDNDVDRRVAASRGRCAGRRGASSSGDAGDVARRPRAGTAAVSARARSNSREAAADSAHAR